MNRNEATGTKRSKYAPAKDGPFSCDRCIHYHRVSGDKDQGTCDHPEVQADAKDGEIPSNTHGLPLVDAGGCCEYERKN